MTTQTQTFPERAPLLRGVLRLDGIFSMISGAALAAASAMLTGLTGLPIQLILGIGLALIPFGALQLWASAQPRIDRRVAWFCIVVDDLWVLGSLALLFGALPLTSIGWWFVLVLALGVGGIGGAKFIGLRRAGKE